MTGSDDSAGRIHDKLAKLTQDEAIYQGERYLSGIGERHFLASILTEIDEIVMARVVWFRDGRGGRVGAEVASRRLLRLLEIKVLGLPQSAKDLAGVDLTEADADTMELLRNVFAGLVSGSDMVTVRSAPPKVDPDPLAAGLSADRLADAWQIDLDPSARPDAEARMALFLEDGQKDAQAWVELDGAAQVRRRGGGGDALEVLLDLCLTEYVQVTLKDAPAAGKCVLLAGNDARYPAIFVGAIGPCRCLVAVSQARAARLVANWRRLTR